MKSKLRYFLILALLLSVELLAVEPNDGFVIPSKSENLKAEKYLQRIEDAHGIKMTMEAPGLYIFIEKEVINRPFDQIYSDLAAVYLPKNEAQARVFFVPQVPVMPGPEMGKRLSCIAGITKRHREQVNRICISLRSFSVDILARIDKFFSVGMMSIEDVYGVREFGPRFGYLHMVSVDSLGKKKFFHMPASTNLKTIKSGFFDDYINLYDSLLTIMVEGFDACRWDNFDNADEIKKECH